MPVASALFYYICGKNLIMILINVLPLYCNSNNLGERMTADVANSLAEQMADKLSVELKNKVCSKHPNATQTINIVAGVDPLLTFEKVNFCCDDFKNSIQINVS